MGLLDVGGLMMISVFVMMGMGWVIKAQKEIPDSPALYLSSRALFIVAGVAWVCLFGYGVSLLV